jgi:hypothetical protein
LNRRKEEVVAWESRWAKPVAAVTLLAVILIIVSGPLGSVGGSGEAELLRNSHEDSGKVVLGSLLQGLGVLMLAAPLFYFFRVVSARSTRVRTQLVGLIIVAPLFLAASAWLTIGARSDASSAFVNGEAKSTLSPAEAKEKCESDRSEEGAEQFAEEFEPKAGETVLAACERRKVEDNEASNAVGEASLSGVVSGLGIAGGLGFLAALIYSSLWAVRTGIMTRFWGTLGMASGVAFLLGPLFVVTMVWFIYFALLVWGRLPGGRPPAWAAGEAVPWPTPGERMAKELEPKVDGPDSEDGEGSGAEGIEAPEPEEAPEPAGDDSSPGGGPRRKRKRRG